MHERPYPYVEFPRHLHKPGGRVCVAWNEHEKADALAAGWSLEPVPEPEQPSEPPSPRDPADIRTLNVIDAIALVGAADSLDALGVLEATEKLHPKYDGGRKGVLDAIGARLVELAAD